jgi:SAM-dependent methyltransferase
MSQNIYDTPEFFANYSQLRRSREGLAGAVEWPRLQGFLPDLQGARVVDLGCGMGWYCRWMREHGAASVRGIDVSQNMLDRAREMDAAGGFDGITYERADLDDTEVQRALFPETDDGAIDVVFSSLAVHYLSNLPQLVAQVHRVLKPGGVFVFSAEHPIFTAPSAPGMVEIPLPKRPGDKPGEESLRRVWPLNDYQVEGLRVTNWLADGVRKYHRTATSYVNILLDSGFELTGFNEWYPNKDEIEANPNWLVDHPSETIKPTFLLMRGTKRVI